MIQFEKFEILYRSADIQAMVHKMALAIEAAYPVSETLVCVGVLKGAWIFHADLVRALKRPVIVDFIRAASYGDGVYSSGTVRILKDLEVDVNGKHVLLVEEIIDSGRTLEFIQRRLAHSKARSIKIAALLDKKERRVIPCEADFLGAEISNDFVVGYGLDWGEKYRNLPDIYKVPREILQ